MKVRTSAVIGKKPEIVWPLLCNSKMTESAPLLFKFCIPKPVECRLKTGVGAVGSERQCVSNLGIINQRITCWEENRRLAFEMKDTDLYFGKCVTDIKDTFDLVAIDQQRTEITRTTEFKVRGWFGALKSLPVLFGLKNVHRYVFKNWAK